MRKQNPQEIFITSRQVLRDLLLLLFGSVLCALAINGILIPRVFVTGGITGIALIVLKFMPSFNLSLIYLLLNLPLFALAWMSVGRRFFFFSVVGAIFITVAIFFIHIPINLEDRMLNALLAGLILGVGSGLCLRSSGSSGGMDILSVMLLQRFSISIGNTILVVNSLILLLISIFYSVESVLYTLIIIFVSSKVMDTVVTGLSQRKTIFIISPHWHKISQEILKDINRGVTFISGRGGFSEQEENIIYAVIPLTEIGPLKRLIQRIDPEAFVVISDAREVLHSRLGNGPHW